MPINHGRLELVTKDDSDTPCPHIYFTAWNELFCLFPKTYVYYRKRRFHCEYSERDEDDYDERFMIGYQIDKYSTGGVKWTKVCSLEVPKAYHYHGEVYDHPRPDEEVAFLKFKALASDEHVLISMVNQGGHSDNGFHPRKSNAVKYLTVTQLNPDGSGDLKAEAKFHRKTKEAGFLAEASLSATSGKLVFQMIEPQGRSSWPSPARNVTELNLTTGV